MDYNLYSSLCMSKCTKKNNIDLEGKKTLKNSKNQIVNGTIFRHFINLVRQNIHLYVPMFLLGSYGRT